MDLPCAGPADARRAALDRVGAMVRVPGIKQQPAVTCMRRPSRWRPRVKGRHRPLVRHAFTPLRRHLHDELSPTWRVACSSGVRRFSVQAALRASHSGRCRAVRARSSAAPARSAPERQASGPHPGAGRPRAAPHPSGRRGGGSDRGRRVPSQARTARPRQPAHAGWPTAHVRAPQVTRGGRPGPRGRRDLTEGPRRAADHGDCVSPRRAARCPQDHSNPRAFDSCGLTTRQRTLQPSYFSAADPCSVRASGGSRARSAMPGHSQSRRRC